MNNTAASKNSFFFFQKKKQQSQKIKIIAQESTEITFPTTTLKFVAMSRSHKLITLASNTTHKII
jgi:ABC-type Mn2+/Zn2+ transport system ATPase subunit